MDHYRDDYTWFEKHIPSVGGVLKIVAGVITVSMVSIYYKYSWQIKKQLLRYFVKEYFDFD